MTVSNTTLVKVKFQSVRVGGAFFQFQIQHLLKLNIHQAVKQFKLPYFVFKFHHKHFLISAYPIRNEMLDPIRKVKGVWTYSTGLYNVADFVKEFPENKKQHVHQFNLSKLDPTRLLHIW